MRTIPQIDGDTMNTKYLIRKLNRVIAQSNKHKEEIRQIKQKLRVNSHFQRLR